MAATPVGWGQLQKYLNTDGVQQRALFRALLEVFLPNQLSWQDACNIRAAADITLYKRTVQLIRTCEAAGVVLSKFDWARGHEQEVYCSILHLLSIFYRPLDDTPPTDWSAVRDFGTTVGAQVAEGATLEQTLEAIVWAIAARILSKKPTETVRKKMMPARWPTIDDVDHYNRVLPTEFDCLVRAAN